MPNLYTTVDRMNRVLDTDSSDIPDMTFFIEAESRQIDRFCHRHFYEHVQTRVFDSRGSFQLEVPDLISITTLKTDEDGDLTYEVTWATTDYFLLPNNADPATSLNAESFPYSLIEYNPEGTGNYFPRGRQRTQIVGSWGYWKHLKTATETADTISSTTATTMTRSVATDIELGHTILIDSEQIFVSGVNNLTLTVVRGVNGTTAATHDNASAISIYEYPPQLEQAILLQASRIARRSQTGGVNEIGILQGGATAVGARMDVDVMQLLDGVRLRNVG